MANALTPTSWFYSIYSHTPERHNKCDYPSRLEISFLLDSSTSISVLNCQAYVTISKLLKITNKNKTPNSSKTLTVAKQTEVPILHYIALILNTAIDHNSRQFIFPFALLISNISFLVLHFSKILYKKY